MDVTLHCCGFMYGFSLQKGQPFFICIEVGIL